MFIISFLRLRFISSIIMLSVLTSHYAQGVTNGEITYLVNNMIKLIPALTAKISDIDNSIDTSILSTKLNRLLLAQPIFDLFVDSEEYQCTDSIFPNNHKRLFELKSLVDSKKKDSIIDYLEQLRCDRSF